MTFLERKLERARDYFMFDYGWRLIACSACSGTGVYDSGGSQRARRAKGRAVAACAGRRLCRPGKRSHASETRFDVGDNAWQGALFSATKEGEENERWGTPLPLFTQLRDLTAGPNGFALDPAAEDVTAKAPIWCGPTHTDPWMRDGLGPKWSTWVSPNEWTWLNPPYGEAVPFWTEKVVHEVRDHQINVVVLVLARADTRWWHRDVLGHASRLLWVPGRVRFIDPVTRKRAKNGCPAPSVAIVYEQGTLGECRSFGLPALVGRPGERVDQTGTPE